MAGLGCNDNVGGIVLQRLGQLLLERGCGVGGVAPVGYGDLRFLGLKRGQVGCAAGVELVDAAAYLCRSVSKRRVLAVQGGKPACQRVEAALQRGRPAGERRKIAGDFAAAVDGA